jgi:predicted NUDIX family NTP pyrophosphohydrolase
VAKQQNSQQKAQEAASPITWKKVEGNSVYRSDGTKVGEIKRFISNKTADEVDAGLAIYRTSSGPEILLTHPGGPFWSRRDDGCWSIPTWSISERFAEPGDLLSRARREFGGKALPEGGLIPLAPVEQKSAKTLQTFAVEADVDLKVFRSNEFSLEWPMGSGRWQTFPEIDRIAYFSLRTALRKILPTQWPLLLELSEKLGWRITRRIIPGLDLRG